MRFFRSRSRDESKDKLDDKSSARSGDESVEPVEKADDGPDVAGDGADDTAAGPAGDVSSAGGEAPAPAPDINAAPTHVVPGESLPTAPAESDGNASPTAAIEGEKASPTPADTSTRPGFFARLRKGLNRTSDNLVAGLGNLFLGRKSIDDELFEELESQLLMADVGIEATTEIIDRLTARVSRRELAEPEALMRALRDELLDILTPCEQALDVTTAKPYVILVVGVNGVGKTTTIGKLASRFQGEGRSVMLAAGDTFRAAAVEQLQHWGERHDVPVIAQHTGADSASVIFDALQAAQARGVDVLIADTAGRLSNKSHLMDELAKVVRVLGKLEATAPHEVMLVLDAGTGQNALAQADQFREAVGVTGLTLTKLDGTAKGGVIFAIARRLRLPIRFIGVGESAGDLRPFVADDFIRALFDRD